MHSWLIIVLMLLYGCHTASSSKKITIAASATPHAEILERVKPVLAEQDIELEILIIEDYNLPNKALAEKKVDANYFQHVPFLEVQERTLGCTLEPYFGVHMEPMGLYSKKIKSLAALSKGDIVAVPQDPTNQARGLALLEREGLIRLRGRDKTISIEDISENALQLHVVEIDSALLTHALNEVDLAAITTNFAFRGGLNPAKDALAMENNELRYVNIVVIREEDVDRPEMKAFKSAMQSELIRDFIQENYHGSVVPAF